MAEQTRCEICGLPKDLCMCTEVAKSQQSNVKLYTEKTKFNKLVTVVEGIDTAVIDIDDLASKLKKKCATGGTVKEGKIRLQGDQSKKAKAVLKELGVPVE